MISRLQGTLIDRQATTCLVDVHGVGYEVHAPLSTGYQLPELNQPVTLLTHMVVREDAQILYGFISESERELFRQLVKVNGVGPKLALAILSGMSVTEFIQCLQDKNTAALVRMPGVGKKTAERLIVEMRDKLKDSNKSVSSLVDGEQTDGFVIEESSGIYQEAVSALIALGYKPQEASKSVTKYQGQANTSEELIKLALKG